MKKITIVVSLLLAVCLLPQVALGQAPRSSSSGEVVTKIVKGRAPHRVLSAHHQVGFAPAPSRAEVLLQTYAREMAFHSAIAKSDYNALAKLLEAGADPNSNLGEGRTPLMEATIMGASLDIITLLLDKGADKDAKDDLGRTAADYAQMRAQMTVALLNGDSEVRQCLRRVPALSASCALRFGMTQESMSVAQAYQVLGVYPEDHAREIVSAYEMKLKTWHPDKWADKSAEYQAYAAQQLKKVQEAYRVITESRTPKEDK